MTRREVLIHRLETLKDVLTIYSFGWALEATDLIDDCILELQQCDQGFDEPTNHPPETV